MPLSPSPLTVAEPGALEAPGRAGGASSSPPGGVPIPNTTGDGQLPRLARGRLWPKVKAALLEAPRYPEDLAAELAAELGYTEAQTWRFLRGLKTTQFVRLRRGRLELSAKGRRAR